MDKNIDMKNKKNKENPLPLMKRLLGYILKNYKFSCIAVLVCILVSALTTLIATLFIQKLIDSYIIPLTQSAVHDMHRLQAHLSSSLQFLWSVYYVHIATTELW